MQVPLLLYYADRRSVESMSENIVHCGRNKKRHLLFMLLLSMLLVLHCVFMCLIITVELLFRFFLDSGFTLAFFAITHCTDNARQKANLVFLGSKAPKSAYGEQMWTFEEGAGPGRSPGSKCFGGIKTPQKCIYRPSGYKLY